MNRDHFLKLIEAIRSLLLANGIKEDAAEEIEVSVLAELFTSIWNNSVEVRERFKTKKEFIHQVNLDLQHRLTIKTRYERDPVI